MRRWFGYDLRVWRLIADNSNFAVDINGIRAEFTPEELDEAQDFDDSLDRQFDRRYPHVVQLCNEWWAELNPPVEDLAVEGPEEGPEEPEEAPEEGPEELAVEGPEEVLEQKEEN